MRVATAPGRIRVLLSAVVLAGACALVAPLSAASAATAKPCNPHTGCTTTSRPHGPPSSTPGCGHSKPYGCTTTSSPSPAGSASCALSIDVGGPGALVTVTCASLTPGSPLEIVLDGHTVFEGSTRAAPADLHPAAVAVAQPFNAAGHASSTTTRGSYVRFRVPDLAPGSYRVFVATASSNEALGTFRLTSTPGRAAAGGSGGVSPLGIGLLGAAGILTLAAGERHLRSRRRAR